MKRNCKRIFYAILYIIALISFIGCSNNIKIPPEVSIPDYSDSGKSFDFFAYAAPTDGSYRIDGTIYNSGEDYRTVERYKEYKDAGMTMLMLRYENAYNGEPWETSNTKLCFENAYAAGIDKILVTDNRLNALIKPTLPFGDNAVFASESEFEAFIVECLAVYKEMSGFYGVILVDEPDYEQIESYALVYKAIKKVLPDAYIHCNMAAMGQDLIRKFDPSGTYDNVADAYRAMMRLFFEKSGAKEISFDSYPFKERGEGIKTNYYSNIKIMAEVCREYGAELHTVAQTCWTLRNNSVFYRKVGKSEIYSQMNSYIGFGVTDICYFTYFTKQDNTTSTELFMDDGSFINRDGEKTEIYTHAQKINAEFQAMADVILSHSYNASAMFTHMPSNYLTSTHTANFENDALKLIETVETDNDIALVTELYDRTNDSYMYMVQNIVDPGYALEGRTEMNVSVQFDSSYRYVAVLDSGRLQYRELDDGLYQTVLSAGYAQYLIPLK